MCLYLNATPERLGTSYMDVAYMHIAPRAHTLIYTQGPFIWAIIGRMSVYMNSGFPV